MSQQLIFLGTAANDGTGDPARDAGEMINENFADLYTKLINPSGDIPLALAKAANLGDLPDPAAAATALVLGTADSPTFAGSTLAGTGLGADVNLSCIKFVAIGETDTSCILRYLDSGDTLHSALVFADNVQGFGTTRTQIDVTKGGNFLQKEHHFLGAGGRMEEINWTVMHQAGDERRLMNWTTQTTTPWQDRFEFAAPLNIVVPASQDLSGAAALYVSYVGPLAAGYYTNVRIVNASVTSNASWLELSGPTAEWTVGTDRYASGRNNWFVWSVTSTKYPIMATPNGVVINRLLADNTDPIATLEVNGTFAIDTATPATAAATGAAGMIAWDANFIYVCVADNTWKRVAIATWV